MATKKPSAAASRKRPAVGRHTARNPAREWLLQQVGERLRLARKSLEMTQRDLGRAFGQARGRGIQDNELGISMPSGDTLYNLMGFGISPIWLLTGTGQMTLDSEMSAWPCAKNPRTSAPLFMIQPSIMQRLAGISHVVNVYAYYMEDDSMGPYIRPGDMGIFCKIPVKDIPAGRVCLLQRGREFLVRRISRKRGRVIFSSDNAVYGDFSVPAYTFTRPNSPVQSLGILVMRCSSEAPLG